jgi:uncharacterized protein (DUF952 family)
LPKAAKIPRGVIDKGFIHLATKEQTQRIIDKFWKDKKTITLKLKTNELEKLGQLIFESNKPGGSKYYHLYTEEQIPRSALIVP